jgi:acyl-CoA thioesterase I
MSLNHFHRRIVEKINDAAAAPVLIVAFGDSVTQGMTVLGQQTHDRVYHTQFKRSLELYYPNCTFSIINAGVSGQTAADALKRLDRDVIRHQPDLTLIAFGLNDAWQGLPGLVGFKTALTTLVRRTQAETHSDVMVLTPSFMNKAVDAAHAARVAPEHQGLIAGMAAIQNSGTLAAYAEAIREVAEACDGVCADVYAEWQRNATGGVNTDVWLANGLNHPTEEAHSMAADLLMRWVLKANAG